MISRPPDKQRKLYVHVHVHVHTYMYTCVYMYVPQVHLLWVTCIYMYMYACTYVHQQPLTVLRMNSMYPSSSCTRASPSLVFTRYTPSLWAPWYSPKFCAGTSHNMYVHTSMYHSRCCVHVHTTAGTCCGRRQSATCICTYCTCMYFKLVGPHQCCILSISKAECR